MLIVTSQNEKTTLLGKTKQDYASIVSWLSFTNQEVLPKLGAWYRPLLGFGAYNKKTVDETAQGALKTLSAFETHLTANTYLVGERITLADVFSAALISRAFGTVLDKKWRSENPATVRWFNTIINQDAFKAVCPEVKFTDEVIKYVAPKKEEKPKAAAPAAAAAAAPAAPPAEPKAPKHPLEALGKPTLIINDWKVEYSNSDDLRGSAMAWFWKNFNAEEYSLWEVDYNYNPDLNKQPMMFMVNNLIGGFHARLEASRKYLFGAQAVYGVKGDCLIHGVFMVRGQDHKVAFDVAPDWESYNYRKLDASSEADRKVVEDSWCVWEPSKGNTGVPVVVDGKTYEIDDGHVFK